VALPIIVAEQQPKGGWNLTRRYLTLLVAAACALGCLRTGGPADIGP
jgi:hypothetical protein